MKGARDERCDSEEGAEEVQDGGYTLKVEALNEALAFLTHFPEHVHDDALDLLLDELHQQTLKSSILDKEPMNRVVSLLLEAEAATAVEESPNSSGLRIIDGFIIPKFRYDPVKKASAIWFGSAINNKVEAFSIYCAQKWNEHILNGVWSTPMKVFFWLRNLGRYMLMLKMAKILFLTLLVLYLSSDGFLFPGLLHSKLQFSF
ncbi:hypothetical protein Acr_00g0092570 [Actinidia rufa]|uniref:Uncharacterized protein n=1 Tax=Actinidia rufa TaxID=165716 RepID=A0A7J0DY56_9ERIC|nr:hypothetical protein Acr_00g0092570 [Actinidia rufa]